MEKKAILLGAEDAPLFRNMLRNLGFELIDEQISVIDTANDFTYGSPQEKAIAFSREKVFRMAQKREKNGELILGFHAVAVFNNLELKHPQTPEELKEVLRTISGHIYRYCAVFSMGVASGVGEIEKFSSKLVTIFPEVKTLTEEEINFFVSQIKPDEIARNGPACRPLLGGINKLLINPGIDMDDYEKSMQKTISKLLEDVKFMIGS